MPRLRPLWLALPEIASRLRAADALFVALDFDGTLVPVADHPDAVNLSPRTRALLERMVRREGLHPAIFSGRSMSDIESQLAGLPLYLAGAGGVETRDEQGRRQTHAAPESRPPAELHEALATWCERFPGSWIEEKGLCFSVHYRKVAPALQPAFCAGVRRRARPHRGRMRMIHGRRVFEFLPAASEGKTAVLRNWRGQFAANGLLFYFGDDTNDEPVHQEVRERGGIAVAVDRTVSAAEFVVASADEVLWFLEWLDREWAALETVDSGSQRMSGT